MASLATPLPTATVATPVPTATATREAPVLPLAAAYPAGRACVRGPLRADDEIVIGALFPLSNPQMMANGFAMLAASNLALADINENGGIGGKRLRSVVYDTGSLPEQGALFAERLITLDCVAAIVGVFHSDVAVAVKEVAIRYHIPVIFADPYVDELTTTKDSEVFRIAPTRTMLIDMMSDWLNAVGDYNQDGEQLVFIIAENSEYGRERLQRMAEVLPARGIQPELFAVDLPTTDFSPVVARIVSLDRLPDVIYLYLHNGDVLPLAKQLIDAGIGPERNSLLVLTSKMLDDQHFWQTIPNGNYLIAMKIGPWQSTIDPFGQSFVQRFQQYFPRWPEASAFEAYDAVWLIANAISRANSVDADAIIDALESTDLSLASGHYTFPYGSGSMEANEPVAPYLWHQWPTPPVLYLQYTAPNQPAAAMRVIWPPVYSGSTLPIAPELQEQLTRLGFRR